MNSRDNILRAARFEKPEYIPLNMAIPARCYGHYDQNALQDLQAVHPLLFPDFKKVTGTIVPQYAPHQRKDVPYTDSWGCVWETSENGMTGAVTKHPLADWASFAGFCPPDPEKENGWSSFDWAEIRKRQESWRKNGTLVKGGLRHGHTFLTLIYLRGYENLIFDMMDEVPQLDELITMVKEFNCGFVKQWLDAGVEWMEYPEDLGMQRGPMLSPDQFRKYIKPVYRELVEPTRQAGCMIHMHSDGDIRELTEDLIELGINVLNLQDLVNGLDWMKDNLKGRVCIDLDIDRQSLTRFGSPEQIDCHIREAVEKLGSRNGGLILKYELNPGVPLENVKAVMDAMEKYSSYYS